MSTKQEKSLQISSDLLEKAEILSKIYSGISGNLLALD